MGKGRKTLIEENQNLEVVESTETVGVAPFLMIDDEYGISCDDCCYALCRKKIINKKVEIDGVAKIEQRVSWQKISYGAAIFEVLKSYMNKKPLKDLKDKQFLKAEEVMQIIKNTADKADDCMQKLIYDNDVEKLGKLEATRRILTNEINDLIKMKNDLKSEYDKTMAIIKEASKLQMKK